MMRMMSLFSTMRRLMMGLYLFTNLLLFLSTADASSSVSHRFTLEREALFNLQPFSIQFSSTHHEFYATGESSPFTMIKFEMAQIVGAYLEGYLNGMLPRTPLQGYYKTHSVDLQVSSFTPIADDSNRRNLQKKNRRNVQGLQDELENDTESPQTWKFKAEIYGIAKFLLPIDEDIETSPRDQVEHVLNTLVRDAFDGTLSSLKKRLMESEDEVLRNIVEVSVETDLPGTLEEASTNPPAIQESSSSKKFGKTEFLLTFLMGGFLLASIFCFYLYASREYHDRQRKKYATHQYLDDDEYPHSEQEEVNQYLANRPSLDRTLQNNSDPANNGTDGKEELIPIAAPSQEDEEVPPRRYMNPASPFEVLYGAAFMHQDQAAVEKARRAKKNIRKKRRVSTDGIRPMLAIAEEELSTSQSYSTASSEMPILSTFIHKLTGGYFDQSRAVGEYQEGKNLTSPTGVNEVDVVYRDFPRHDGTPCLMYSPQDEEENGVEVAESPLIMQEIYIDEGSYHSTGSMLSADDFSEVKLPEVDNFVLQLEHLMILRQKQYQERIKMEQEHREFSTQRILTRHPSIKNPSIRRPSAISYNSRRTSEASQTSVLTAEELQDIEDRALAVEEPSSQDVVKQFLSRGSSVELQSIEERALLADEPSQEVVQKFLSHESSTSSIDGAPINNCTSPTMETASTSMDSVSVGTNKSTKSASRLATISDVATEHEDGVFT